MNNHNESTYLPEPPLLAEDLLLLMLDEASGRPAHESTATCLVGAALLIDLVAAGAVDPTVLDGGPLVCRPGAHLSDPLLHESFLKLQRWRRPRIEQLGRFLQHKVGARLVERGLVRTARGKAAGIIPITVFPVLPSAHGAVLLREMAAALAAESQPQAVPPRITHLLGLLSAGKYLDVIARRCGLPQQQAVRRARMYEKRTPGAGVTRSAVGRRGNSLLHWLGIDFVLTVLFSAG